MLRFGVIFFLSFSLWAASPQEDDLFLAAKDAARVGDQAKLARLSESLKNHPLFAYVRYWQLSTEVLLSDPNAKPQIVSFLKENSHSYLAERLRLDWLKRLGRLKDEKTFYEHFSQITQPEQDLLCYDLLFRINHPETKAQAILDMRPLWLTLTAPPDACLPVLDALIVEKNLGVDDVWARIRRQFEANKMSAAKTTFRYLPLAHMPQMASVTAVMDKPLPWLITQGSFAKSSRTQKELAALAIAKIAKNDPELSASHLSNIAQDLDPNLVSWAYAEIADEAARKHLNASLTWYQAAGHTPLSQDNLEWKVRAALRGGDWRMVEAAILAMPEEAASDPAWVYWLARAKAMFGKKEEANALYLKIAKTPNFYGNLADVALGEKSALPPEAPPPTPEEAARARQNASFIRALALFALDLRTEAVREWNFGLRHMSDRELLAAAHYAKSQAIYDRAVASADRTKTEHSYLLRYLAPFYEEVRAAAEKQNLEPAWVYGLIRQESRFVMRAKSQVGASGLMQLMPATARYVAKKIGLKNYHPGQVENLETNLRLGTSYMRMVSDAIDSHPILVSAAYNAGPGRARRWRDVVPMEAAIYAETIPFAETRDYVKKVLSHTMYYAMRFEGKPRRLDEWLPNISAQTKTASDDLP